jgi:hypothetical protein
MPCPGGGDPGDSKAWRHDEGEADGKIGSVLFHALCSQLPGRPLDRSYTATNEFVGGRKLINLGILLS